MAGTVVDEKLLQRIKESKNEEVVKLLKAACRDVVCYTTKEGTPILNEVILSNNTAAARLLLEKGADPCSTDSKGQTAVHAAAQVDQVSLLHDLLQTSSIHTQDLDGNTPLHTAVRYTCVNAVRWLVFFGANPLAVNKNKQTCRAMTKKNQIIQLLRDYSPNRPAVRYARLEMSKDFTSDGLPFSIRLAAPCSRSPCLAFACSFIQSMASDKLRLLDLKSSDEGWGPAVEYLCLEEPDVSLTFPLADLPPPMHEVVLMVLDTYNDTTCQVQVRVSQDLSTGKQETTMNKFIAVARGDVTMRLPSGGVLQLVCQPLKQSFSLEKGHNSVKSVLDDRVEIIANNTEVPVTGILQIEPCPPVKEPAALYAAPATRDTGFESQSNFVTVSSRTRCSLTIELPLPNEHGSGPIAVYVRNQSVDSGYVASPQLVHEGYFTFARNLSIDPDTSDTDNESDLERESRHWEKVDTVSPQSNARTIKVPAAPNKTMTVVGSASRSVHEGQQRQGVARQYRKRKYKKCLFFVAARALESWRECHEVLVVVTSPNLLSTEFSRHLEERYCLLHVSGIFLTKSPAIFQLNVLGNLLVHSGEGEAMVTFNQALRQTDTTNCALFVLRRASKTDPGVGKISIHLKKKRKARKGGVPWKYKGELHFDLSKVVQVWRLDGITHKELSYPFSDQLLLNLVDTLQTSKSDMLGIRLGLTASHVDSIMHNHCLPTPNIKCFEILRQTRDRSVSVKQFGQNLVAALREMEWNQQCEWLLDQLTGWPQRAEIE